jgi:hypothetical protein
LSEPGTSTATARATFFGRDTNGDVAIWFMNGTQVAQSAGVGNVPPNVWKLVGTGDFNGDGKSDILWRAGHGSFNAPNVCCDWAYRSAGGV